MSFNLDEYEPVEVRLEKFWADHKTGRVLTELQQNSDAGYIVQALVYRDQDDSRPAATGWAQETVAARGVNATSALENCETSAIGRALANLGYAAKGKRASREEMEKTQRELDPRRPLWVRIWALGESQGLDSPRIYAAFAEWSGGVDLRSAAADQLERYIKHITPKEPAGDSSVEPLPGTIATPTDAAAAAERLRARASGARLRPAKSERLAAAQGAADVAAADGPGERPAT